MLQRLAKRGMEFENQVERDRSAIPTKPYPVLDVRRKEPEFLTAKLTAILSDIGNR